MPAPKKKSTYSFNPLKTLMTNPIIWVMTALQGALAKLNYHSTVTINGKTTEEHVVSDSNSFVLHSHQQISNGIARSETTLAIGPGGTTSIETRGVDTYINDVCDHHLRLFGNNHQSVQASINDRTCIMPTSGAAIDMCTGDTTAQYDRTQLEWLNRPRTNTPREHKILTLLPEMFSGIYQSEHCNYKITLKKPIHIDLSKARRGFTLEDIHIIPTTGKVIDKVSGQTLYRLKPGDFTSERIMAAAIPATPEPPQLLGLNMR